MSSIKYIIIQTPIKCNLGSSVLKSNTCFNGTKYIQQLENNDTND